MFLKKIYDEIGKVFDEESSEFFFLKPLRIFLRFSFSIKDSITDPQEKKSIFTCRFPWVFRTD